MIPFIDDEEKMRDFKELTKEEFLQTYSYLTEEEYDATQGATYILTELYNIMLEERSDFVETLEKLREEGGDEFDNMLDEQYINGFTFALNWS